MAKPSGITGVPPCASIPQNRDPAVRVDSGREFMSRVFNGVTIPQRGDGWLDAAGLFRAVGLAAKRGARGGLWLHPQAACLIALWSGPEFALQVAHWTADGRAADTTAAVLARMAADFQAGRGAFTSDLVVINQLAGHYGLMQHQVADFLRKQGAVSLGLRALCTGRQKVWAIRNPDLWSKATSGAIITYYRPPTPETR